ncbi:hypothetical protein F5Y15DRAFT_375842 [Xylariaceae sp. FL0016]|nr:hypothetical protein F5Y15DRAFT_375842 [Xylariaceae sp. FL0016]
MKTALILSTIISLAAFALCNEECCSSLAQAGLADRIVKPGSFLDGNGNPVYSDDDMYAARVSSYWSLSAQLRPTCIVLPLSAEEVSTVVKTLVASPKCQFAIRSGGHMVWAGSNNIENGVTIDLGYMNTTAYHPENTTAAILPGAIWLNVYETLDALGVTVAGGRAGKVGVGGLILGGGNSFHSARAGMACDSVFNFQVVLANGDIVDARKDTNPDLFKALKGGSSNFGIVTRFDMEAFEAPVLWGGVNIYNKTKTDQHIEAFVDFCDNVEHHPHSSSIVFWTYLPAFKDTVLIAALENTNGETGGQSFGKVLEIDAITSTQRLTNMTDLTRELNQPGGYRDIWFTLSFKNDARVVKKAVDLHDELVEELKSVIPDGDFITMSMFQPIPTVFAKHSAAKGGNVMGLDRAEDNLIMWLANLAVKTPELELIGHSLLSRWVQSVKDYAESIGADSEWVYLNYADPIMQDPLASYGPENLAFLQAVASKYDPDRVFQTRVPGGFKLPKLKGSNNVKDEL